jgi:hypothetical protein
MHAAAREHTHHLAISNRGALALRKRCPSAHPLSCPAVVYLRRLLTATLTFVGSYVDVSAVHEGKKAATVPACGGVHTGEHNPNHALT